MKVSRVRSISTPEALDRRSYHSSPSVISERQGADKDLNGKTDTMRVQSGGGYRIIRKEIGSH